MNRRTLSLSLGLGLSLGLSLACLITGMSSTAAMAGDAPYPGAYVLTYQDQAVAVELVPQGEARTFTIEIEGFTSPLTVVLTFDGKGGVSGNAPLSGGAWKFTGMSDGGKISGNTIFTYGGASATAPFELLPRAQYKDPIGLGIPQRRAKPPRKSSR